MNETNKDMDKEIIRGANELLEKGATAQRQSSGIIIASAFSMIIFFFTFIYKRKNNIIGLWDYFIIFISFS